MILFSVVFMFFFPTHHIFHGVFKLLMKSSNKKDIGNLKETLIEEL